MDPLGTDSCRGTVPMEPLMSNGSMHHWEPKSETYDTGHFLQGASCTKFSTIAACCAAAGTCVSTVGFTVLMGSTKESSFKIHFFHVVTDLLKHKFHTDFKNDLKKFHMISEGHKSFDKSFAGNIDTKFQNCMGKAGLNLNR
jgi:hypothetical protein